MSDPTELINHEPRTDVRPIPEPWNLITAGDGAIWQSSGFGKDRHWRPVDFLAPAIWVTDAEILELGPVHEAVIVTLPDQIRNFSITGDSDGVHVRLSPGSAQPDRVAAELLAAARATSDAIHAALTGTETCALCAETRPAGDDWPLCRSHWNRWIAVYLGTEAPVRRAHLIIEEPPADNNGGDRG